MDILFRNSHISNNQIVKQLGFKSTAPRIAGAFYSSQESIQLDKFQITNFFNKGLVWPLNSKTLNAKYESERIAIILCDWLTKDAWDDRTICGIQNEQPPFVVDLFNKDSNFENGFEFSGIDQMSVLIIVDLSEPRKLKISRGAALKALKRAIPSCACRSINECVILASQDFFADIEHFIKREQQYKTVLFEMLANGWSLTRHASDNQMKEFAPYTGKYNKFNQSLHYEKKRKVVLESLSKTSNMVKFRHILLATQTKFFREKLEPEECKNLVTKPEHFKNIVVMRPEDAGRFNAYKHLYSELEAYKKFPSVSERHGELFLFKLT